MSLEEVIISGEKAKGLREPFIFQIYTTVVICSMFILFILIWVFDLVITPLIFGSSVVLYIISYCIYLIKKSKGANLSVEDWDMNIAKPFIENLPVTRFEVVALYFTSTKDIDIKYLLEDGELKSQKIEEVIIKRDPMLTNKKYIEVRVLEKDLPSLYTKGWYKPVLIVPENFDFSTLYQKEGVSQ